jgi:hypothetical protein
VLAMWIGQLNAKNDRGADEDIKERVKEVGQRIDTDFTTSSSIMDCHSV